VSSGATVVVAQGARRLRGWSMTRAGVGEQAGEERPSGDGARREERDAVGRDGARERSRRPSGWDAHSR
jgi:hypothetical protein